MKKIITISALIITLMSCGENKNEAGGKLTSFDACSCATVQDMNGEDYKKCKELRTDAKFEADYQKCKLAQTSGIQDTSRITIQNSATATNLNPAEAGAYNFDISTSAIRWYGEKITGKKHNGTLNLKKGYINIVDGKIASGEIIIDMNTLTNLDQSGEGKAKLEGHLKSEDFFNVAKFPDATYVITSATASSAYDYDVTGKLTIKGISKEVKSHLVIAPNGKDVNIGGGLTFDRSEFDVRYGSDKFFDNLGNDMIKNDVLLTIDIKAKKS